MISLFRQFKHDLNQSVINDITRTHIRYGRIIFASLLVAGFILSKPSFQYYQGVLERQITIQKLAAENKLLPEFEEQLISRK